MAFKICTVGCGGMANGGHGPSFRKYAQEREGVVLAGCCDVDLQRAEDYRGKFGFQKAYTDMEEMLKAEKPDAVSLVVPVALTERLSIQVMEMGYPVILEKPPGMDREQTLRMMEVAERTGVPNQVSFNRRFMPIIRRFKELRQGMQGQLWQYEFYRINRHDADFSTTSIHGIDTMKFLAGSDYKSVRFFYYPNPVDPGMAPAITLECTFQDGQAGRITFAPGTGIAAERCTMHGSNEMIYATMPYHGNKGSLDENGLITIARMGQIVHQEPGIAAEDCVENGFYGENAHFFDCIRAGIRPTDDIASGLQSVEIADCIRKGKDSYFCE